MDVIHTAIWVSDLEATREFYVDALGLDHHWNFGGDDGMANFYVGGDEGGEIQFKRVEDGREVDPDESDFDHVAVSVDDVDEAFADLVEETGCDVRREPFDNDPADARVAFVRDPDGYGVELVESWD